MTQLEEILRVLNSQPRGMTANDLHLRTEVPKNTLGTYLWELKRDGYVRRVGGVRGSYRYGLTEKGRDRIGEGDDPLKQLARAVGSDAGTAAALQDFDETLKVIDHLDEYRNLKRFSEWLAVERTAMFADADDLAARLHRSVLEYMGIDPTTYQKQSRALIGLLEFMKESA